jgi:hypothetical protein
LAIRPSSSECLRCRPGLISRLIVKRYNQFGGRYGKIQDNTSNYNHCTCRDIRFPNLQRICSTDRDKTDGYRHGRSIWNGSGATLGRRHTPRRCHRPPYSSNTQVRVCFRRLGCIGDGWQIPHHLRGGPRLRGGSGGGAQFSECQCHCTGQGTGFPGGSGGHTASDARSLSCKRSRLSSSQYCSLYGRAGLTITSRQPVTTADPTGQIPRNGNQSRFY